MDGEVEEVGVDEDAEGRAEIGVVVEEQRGGYLWARTSTQSAKTWEHFTDEFGVFGGVGFGGGGEFGFHGFETGVFGGV